MKVSEKILSRALLALFCLCAFVLVFFSATPVGMTASAASASYYNYQRQQTQDKLQAQQNETARIQSELSKQQSALYSQEQLKAAQEAEIASLNAEIELMTNLIRSYNTQIDEKNAESESLQESMYQSFAIFKERLIFLHESNNEDYIDFLLNSGNFTDFLSRAEIMNEFFEYDSHLIDGLSTDRDNLETLKSEIELLKQASEETLRQCEERAIVVQAKIEVLNQTISDYYEAIRAIQAQKSEADSKQASLKAEYDRQTALYNQALAAEKAGNKPGGSGSPGYGLNTARYEGSRFPCPIRNTYYKSQPYNSGSAHYGVDLATFSRSVPIYAAESGTVYKATFHGSWGNFVQLSHGDLDIGAKVYTLYAHMRYSTVSAGETVTKGQVIGYTGNTGNSYGVHLHFELYIGGPDTAYRVNPENY